VWGGSYLSGEGVPVEPQAREIRATLSPAPVSTYGVAGRPVGPKSFTDRHLRQPKTIACNLRTRCYNYGL